MSVVDFDAIEHYKFWKSVIVLLVGGVVSVATLLVARDTVEARNMIAAGYEYCRIVAQRTVSYTYQRAKRRRSVALRVAKRYPIQRRRSPNEWY